ncbi:hypothetical protein [Lentibacillus salinarum]|uniref:WYL domain-containing protein n=1 Tax=Lentibacillus salinarum TaxID=446820 RepID=A0ABW3ZPE2_9BACI
MDRLLKNAIQTRQKLEMIYLDADNQSSHRIIRVLGINKNIVKAFCFSRQKIRTFKTENILSIGPVRHKRMGA